jgi:preprotein translocase YajC subunit
MTMYLVAQETPTAGGFGAFLPLLLIVGLFFMITLPQRRMRKQQAALQESVAVGDLVRTAGGIRGRVISLDTDTATIEIESGQMVVERRAISAKIES